MDLVEGSAGAALGDHLLAVGALSAGCRAGPSCHERVPGVQHVARMHRAEVT
jgi:hypothetical protein